MHIDLLVHFTRAFEQLYRFLLVDYLDSIVELRVLMICLMHLALRTLAKEFHGLILSHQIRKYALSFQYFDIVDLKSVAISE